MSLSKITVFLAGITDLEAFFSRNMVPDVYIRGTCIKGAYTKDTCSGGTYFGRACTEASTFSGDT